MSFVSLLSAGLWIEVVLYVAAGLVLGIYVLRVVVRLRGEPPSAKAVAEDRAAALLRQYRADERPAHRWKAGDTEDAGHEDADALSAEPKPAAPPSPDEPS
jgi:hypothetical protein